jgi:dihydrofolate reductase
METVVADITMSLDGFISGPDDDPVRRLGVGGECLHTWIHSGDETDSDVLSEMWQLPGAIIMGRRMYDINEGFGDHPPFTVPIFVLTHRALPVEVKGSTSFTFVTDGIHSALEQARAVAGDKPVAVGGGAAVIQQYLAAGLVDQMQIHVANVLLGSGIRLFEDIGPDRIGLRVTRVISSPLVTHLRYEVGTALPDEVGAWARSGSTVD